MISTVRKIIAYLTATTIIALCYLAIGYFIEAITETDIEAKGHLILIMTMLVTAGAYYPLVWLSNHIMRRMFPLPQDKLYQTLKEFGSSLSTVHQYEDLGLLVTNLLRTGLDLSGVGLYLWEATGFRKLYSLGIEEGLESWVITLKQFKSQSASLYVNGPGGLGFPLWWNNMVVGILALKPKGSFSKLDKEVLQTLAPQIAAAIANTKLYQDVANANVLNENILRNMPGGVMVWDSGGRVILVNEALADIICLPKGHLTGANLYSIGELKPLYNVLKMSGLQEVVLELKQACGLKTLVMHTTAFKLAEQNINLSVLTDISEFKALQQQLARAERLSALGTMTAGLAHELRNGLHGVQGFTSLLEEASTGDADLNRLARGIREDSERLTRMLNNFLHFASRPELKLETVDLVELLETSVMVVKRLSGTRGITFTIAHGKQELLGDRDKLYQAVINLLLNAAEAKDVTRVKVESEYIACQTVIRIENDGEGIPPATAERAFDPFYTTKPTGTGLGLSIVHQIVTEHGGRVDIENTGCGTRVVICLPDKGEQK